MAQHLAVNHLVYALRTGHEAQAAEARDRALRLGVDVETIIATERHTRAED